MQQRTQFEVLGCKNHPSEYAGYHLVDQPWIKICSQCALNIAISGKKIGKQLSGIQLQNKTLLSAITAQMRHTSQLLDSGNKRISEELQKTEKKSQQEIGNEIRKLNDFIIQLLRMRDELWEMYEEKITKPLNLQIERQSRLILNGMQIKKILDNIQTNFSDLIQENHFQLPLKEEVEQWKELNLQTKLLLSQDNQILDEFQHLKSSFYEKIRKTQIFMSTYAYPQMPKEEKQNIESVVTQTPINESNITTQKMCNTRITHLKLRSNMRKNPSSRQSYSVVPSSKRRSIQEISNFSSRIANFQL